MKKKNNNALILFVKAPRIGEVKTRLQPELTPDQSVMLYRAMVEDFVNKFNNLSFCDLKIFFFPVNANKEMVRWLGDQLDYFPQQGKDLGERMHNAITEMLKQNYEKVAVIGSDIPTLDSTTIVRAFTSLEGYDVVLGPCKDGGYYLIGMKQPHPELFEEISWGTSVVLRQTIQKARTANLEIVQIEKKSDIDTYAEVKDLWKLLKKRNTQEAYSFKSKTYEILKTFFN